MPATAVPLNGYLATPAGEGPWPGVVVVHSAFGVDGDLRSQTDRLAAAGYLALAPDLFTRGSRLRCLRQAFRELRARKGQSFDDIETARAWLVDRPDCTGTVGVIGFCMGGGFALLAALGRGFSAASVNYGSVPDDAEQALRGACPVVGSFGAKDAQLRDHPARLEAALGNLGVDHNVKVYPDVGHSFMNQHESRVAGLLSRFTTMGYGRDAAEDSWERILDFFDAHLRQAADGGTAPGGGPSPT